MVRFGESEMINLSHRFQKLVDSWPKSTHLIQRFHNNIHVTNSPHRSPHSHSSSSSSHPHPYPHIHHHVYAYALSHHQAQVQVFHFHNPCSSRQCPYETLH